MKCLLLALFIILLLSPSYAQYEPDWRVAEHDSVLRYSNVSHSTQRADATYFVIGAAPGKAVVKSIYAFINVNSMIKEVDHVGAYMATGPEHAGYLKVEYKAEVVVNHPGIVSVRKSGGGYEGGAHGWGFREEVSFDPRTGERIKLWDVLLPGDSAAFLTTLYQRADALEGINEESAMTLNGFLQSITADPDEYPYNNYDGDFIVAGGELYLCTSGVNYPIAVQVPLDVVEPHIRPEWLSVFQQIPAPPKGDK